ncbi:MAG: hypothetical protein AAF581_21625 [Planctomycetota bacterium]
MKKSIGSLLTVALVTTLVASLTGCTILNAILGEYTEPEFDIREARVLVPAFRDGRMFHYESTRGDAVGNAVAMQLQSEGGCQLVGDHEVEDGVIRGDYPDPPPWGQLGADAGADFVVLGWLRSVKVSDDVVYGMLQGSAEVRVEVWDTREKRAVHKKTFTVKFPEDTNKEVTPVGEITEMQLEKKLLSRAAVKIGHIYCGEHHRR